MQHVIETETPSCVPSWVPQEVRRYLAHTEQGQSIRSLAREAGCHASTILRQVRRYETRRDDFLVDLALTRLGLAQATGVAALCEIEDEDTMTIAVNTKDLVMPDAAEIRAEAPRVLRRLNEPGACLAIAEEMEKAVIVREDASGQTLRTAVIERPLAEALALKDWVALHSDGRIKRYRITTTGRHALKRFLAESESARAGLTDDASPYAAQHGEHEARMGRDAQDVRRRMRYNATESPLLSLARRRDKSGEPFLSSDLVAAGERLREDFELAQLGPRVAQNWDRFLTAGGKPDFATSGSGGGSEAARKRVTDALSDLGPGLGDAVLRCCCFLEGIEVTEKRMGWSARSGKIVLRIALIRLKKHYDESSGNWSPLIG
ncbi:MAG: helix-turn-helix domain-containing protein [Boseongicola sp.]|nr:helix-turn-helix domain-containing protein [Boseongicola sp.]NNJ66899.1 helix-turn-helix domain-containing protein [Boseongicola sp.]